MNRTTSQLLGVSIRECARQLGVSDTAIRKAIRAGRVIALDDGSVDVDVVRAGMAATADPLRGGARQAGVVAGASMGSPIFAAEPQLPLQVTGAPATLPPVPAGMSVQAQLLHEKLRRESLGREREEIEMATLRGQVAPIEPMARAMADAMIEARSALLALPDRLTPLVTAESDAGKVYSLIEAEVQRVCSELRDKLKALQTSATAQAEEVSI